MIRILVPICLVMAAFNSYAAAWTGFYPTKQVYTYNNGSVFIGLDPATAHSNPDSCTSTGWLAVSPDSVNLKEIHQMALTAQATGTKVAAYVPGCFGSYPKILHLRSLTP